MKSPLFDELSRGEVEKRDVVGLCPGRYPYVGRDVDMEGNSGSLGGQAADEPELAAAVAAMTRSSSRTIRNMMRVACAALAAMALASIAAAHA